MSSDLSGLTVLAGRGEQETILGARSGSEEPLAVWTCPDPVLMISSLSGEEPERWLAEGGWVVRELDRLTVPLKVNAVTSGVTPESRAWLEYLSERGLVPGGDGYDDWHDLRMLECTPS